MKDINALLGRDPAVRWCMLHTGMRKHDENKNGSHLQAFLAVHLILRLVVAVPITTKLECRHLPRLTGPGSQEPLHTQKLCMIVS